MEQKQPTPASLLRSLVICIFAYNGLFLFITFIGLVNYAGEGTEDPLIASLYILGDVLASLLGPYLYLTLSGIMNMSVNTKKYIIIFSLYLISIFIFIVKNLIFPY